jgi:hypothetical protein
MRYGVASGACRVRVCEMSLWGERGYHDYRPCLLTVVCVLCLWAERGYHDSRPCLLTVVCV